MNLRKSLILNLRWHRRIGLSVFVLLIFLAATGIALNHSPTFKLAETRLHNSWLLSWYGIGRDVPHGFQIGDQWLYQTGKAVFLDQREVGTCSGALLSAAHADQLIMALCNSELMLITAEGQLIERYTEAQGLPAGALTLHINEGSFYLSGPNTTWHIDSDALALTQTEASLPAPLSALPLPVNFATQFQGSSISLQTLLLDLHSGRFFGGLGVLLVDLTGVLLCLLAITGLWTWINHQKLRRQ